MGRAAFPGTRRCRVSTSIQKNVRWGHDKKKRPRIMGSIDSDGKGKTR